MQKMTIERFCSASLGALLLIAVGLCVTPAQASLLEFRLTADSAWVGTADSGWERERKSIPLASTFRMNTRAADSVFEFGDYPNPA